MKVRDGQIVDESFTLMHPPAGFDHFDGFNTWLHGINAEMVADAPSWQQVADWVVRYTGSDTLACRMCARFARAGQRSQVRWHLLA